MIENTADKIIEELVSKKRNRKGPLVKKSLIVCDDCEFIFQSSNVKCPVCGGSW